MNIHQQTLPDGGRAKTKDYEKRRNLGSAGKLIGEQRILCVFVDDDGSSPWTLDIRSTVQDHVQRSLRWLEGQAANRGIELRIQHALAPNGMSVGCHAGCHINEIDECAGPHHSGWQNTVVVRITGYGKVSEGWAAMFTSHGLSLDASDGSAMLFFVRRLVPSIAFPYKAGEHDEFELERGIIYDLGGVIDGQRHLDSLIAHELLHLYGAVDLKPGKAPSGVSPELCLDPDEVMNFPTQHEITGYRINELTEYLIGWRDADPVVK